MFKNKSLIRNSGLLAASYQLQAASHKVNFSALICAASALSAVKGLKLVADSLQLKKRVRFCKKNRNLIPTRCLLHPLAFGRILAFDLTPLDTCTSSVNS
jgi:hypothetical protein